MQLLLKSLTPPCVQGPLLMDMSVLLNRLAAVSGIGTWGLDAENKLTCALAPFVACNSKCDKATYACVQGPLMLDTGVLPNAVAATSGIAEWGLDAADASTSTVTVTCCMQLQVWQG